MNDVRVGRDLRMGMGMGTTVGTVEDVEDVQHRDLGRRAREFVSPLRTARAAYEPGATESTEDLVEVGFGDTLAGGDIAALDGSLAESLGKVKQRPDPVVRPT